MSCSSTTFQRSFDHASLQSHRHQLAFSCYGFATAVVAGTFELTLEWLDLTSFDKPPQRYQGCPGLATGDNGTHFTTTADFVSREGYHITPEYGSAKRINRHHSQENNLTDIE